VEGEAAIRQKFNKLKKIIIRIAASPSLTISYIVIPSGARNLHKHSQIILNLFKELLFICVVKCVQRVAGARGGFESGK